MRLIARFVLLVVTLLIATLTLFAQNTAQVRGTVIDPAGRPISSAFLVITGEGNNFMRAASSDDAGEFEFPALPVGAYTIEVKADGFREVVQHNVSVSIGQVLQLKLRLTIGEGIVESSYVNEVPMTETSSTQLGVVTSDFMLSALPLKSRDPFDLLQLQPGVQSTLGADLFFGSDRPGVVSVNGGRARSNNNNVNGAHAGDLFVNMPALQPSADSIREFRVISHTYDAELGRNSGSVLNVVTKSGSPVWHGSAYEYLRNDVLNAKGYFDPARPAFKQNDFGATVGGPLKRDRLFFFSSYEGLRLRRDITGERVQVPSAAERAGDFSSGSGFAGVLNDANLADILNARPGCAGAVAAAGGAPIAAGTSYSAIFPGNVIPRECFDATASSLLGRYVPNSTTGLLDVSAPAPARRDQFTFRLDHNLTAQQQLSAYYYGADGYTNEPFSHFQGRGANVSGFGTTMRERFQQLNIAHTWTINAKTNNEARIAYYRQGQKHFESPQTTNLVQASCTGSVSPDCFQDPLAPATGISPGYGATYEGVPYVALAGGFALGNNPNGYFSQRGNVYQFLDTYSRVLGAHTVKFGVDLRNQRLSQTYFYDVNGEFSFTGGGPNDVGYDTPFANFLLGLPDTFAQGSANNLDVRTWQLHFFGQDTWKLRPNVTLNYGLRWEWNTPAADAGRRVQAFRPGQATSIYDCALNASNPLSSSLGTDCSSTGSAASVFPLGLVFPGDRGVPNGLTNGYKRSFAPRLGLAWSPAAAEGWLAKLTGGPGRTSVRLGWGIFYDSNEELLTAQFAAQPPFGGSTFISNPLFNTPFVSQDGTVNPNPFHGFLNPERGSAVDFSLFRPIFLFGNYPQTLRSQYTEQYHFTIQREVGRNTLFQVGYVGSQAHRLLAYVDENYGNAQTCLDLNQIPGMSCGAFGEDDSYIIPAGAIPAGVTLHLPYGSVSSVTGPNASPITLVGLRKYSSPLCQPTTGEGCPLDGVPVFGSIFGMHPVANSSYNSLQALVNHRFAHGVQFLASYTWSKSIDNASSFENSVNPIDPNLSRSLSLFDARHRFVLSYYWQLPAVHTQHWTHHLLNNWAVSGITTLQSGFPIRITSSSDNELLGSAGFESPGQPDQLAPFRRLDPRTSGGYYFDPATFAEATLGQVGNAPRAVCCGPGIFNFDFAVHRSVPLGENKALQFRSEFFNLFNHTQFLNPDGDISATDTFGVVRRARDPRIIQFAVRFSF